MKDKALKCPTLTMIEINIIIVGDKYFRVLGHVL